MNEEDWARVWNLLLNVVLGIVFLHAASQTLLMFGLWGFLLVIPATVMLLCLAGITEQERGLENNDE